MQVSVKKVRVDYNGEITGLDELLSTVLKLCSCRPEFEDGKKIGQIVGSLSSELMELANLCSEYAGLGKYIAYVIEVHMNERGIVWQRYRVEAAPPLLP